MSLDGTPIVVRDVLIALCGNAAPVVWNDRQADRPPSDDGAYCGRLRRLSDSGSPPDPVGLDGRDRRCAAPQRGHRRFAAGVDDGLSHGLDRDERETCGRIGASACARTSAAGQRPHPAARRGPRSRPPAPSSCCTTSRWSMTTSRTATACDTDGRPCGRPGAPRRPSTPVMRCSHSPSRRWWAARPPHRPHAAGGGARAGRRHPRGDRGPVPRPAVRGRARDAPRRLPATGRGQDRER